MIVVQILLALIFITLVVIYRVLWVAAENSRLGIERAAKDATDIVLLLRGIKAGVWIDQD